MNPMPLVICGHTEGDRSAGPSRKFLAPQIDGPRCVAAYCRADAAAIRWSGLAFRAKGYTILNEINMLPGIARVKRPWEASK
jgi:hypothetical protein